MRKIIYIFLIFFLNLNSFAIENNKLSEITEGSENAKIKIYVYQSLTCPHCAVFILRFILFLKKTI
jgi:thioredoxin-related protein